MRRNLETAGITLHEAPVENPGTIGTVERYHVPLRTDNLKIRMELGRDVTNEYCLKMGVFEVHWTIGPEGLCLILNLFGCFPRPSRKTSSKTHVQRSKAIEGEIIEGEKKQASRSIKLSLRTTSGPEALHASSQLHKLPAGAKVLVLEKKSRTWDGTHTFISIYKETAIIQTEAEEGFSGLHV